MKKNIHLFLALVMTLLLSLVSGCGSQDSSKTVELCFSHQPDRWMNGAQEMKESLEKEGYKVNLTIYNSEEEQKSAMAAAVKAKPKCIVTAGVDTKIVQESLDEAQKENIPIIGYDSLPKDTAAVSYYVTFDNEGVGTAMGKYIEQKFNLRSGAGPFTIEFFSGGPNDSNAPLMYKGMYDVLKPYLDKGQLVVPSGKVTFSDTATKDWDAKVSASRMKELVAKYYTGRSLDIIVSASDGISYGIIDGLADYHGSQPFITGQDADKKALAFIQQGKMGMTIRKDSNDLNQKCIRMIKAVVEGTKPVLNDTDTYNNGAITVPTYLCIPYIVDKDNLSEAAN
jgi:putative multiple sugar transport system substrate-binding protein